MGTAEDYARQARDFIAFYRHGVLSTVSASQAGYPFGSLVPYDVTHDGNLVIYVSLIAEHYKNLAKDPRASITVIDTFGSHDPQAHARVTVLLDFAALTGDDKEQAQKAYEARFPNSVSYELSHNFVFMRGKPGRVRWIGGFGDITWIDAARFVSAKPDPLSYDGMRIVEHMNDDHEDALREMVCAFDKPIGEKAKVRMLAITSSSFKIEIRDGEERKETAISFPAALKSSAEGREAMIKLVKQARQKLAH